MQLKSRASAQMRAAAAMLALFLGLAIAAPVTVGAQDASPEAAASAISVAPGPGEGEVTVTHPQGETVVPLNPEVVVSFDIASIDTLQALGVAVDGAPELGAGSEHYDLSGAQSVGTLFEPDYEAVAALEPGLIIVAARSAAALPELAKIGPTIDLTFAGENFIEELRANTNVLSAIFEKQAEADEIMSTIDSRVAALQEATADAGTGMIIITSGGAVTALAPGAIGGRGSLIYETLGFQLPVEDLEEATHGEPISFEFLLEHDADWLFVLDRDAATGEAGQAAEEVLDNDIFRQTTASQNGQVVYLTPFDWYIIVGGGLDSTQRMLSQLETAFGVE